MTSRVSPRRDRRTGSVNTTNRYTYDVVVVGAGIVGLATVRGLVQRRAGLRIAVLDKEQRVAAHQSGHNSGVIHSGLYYAPGSLKARLCSTGRRSLEAFADEHGIPRRRCGKLVVAVDTTELGRLDELRRRAEANGLIGARVLDSAEIRALEPNVVGIRALYVTETGVIDFARVAGALADDAVASGADVYLGEEVVALHEEARAVTVATRTRELRAGRVVVCAGLQSDRLAALSDSRVTRRERIVPFRGDYYTVAPSARHLVRGLVYPVPDPAFPFLGVHFTRRVDGELWAGPNAVVAFAREGYRRSAVHPRDLVETLAFPGTWRLARRYWRTGLAEAWRDVMKAAFVAQLQRYVPALDVGDLTFGPSGVRAQSVRADGTMVDDFSLTLTPARRILHVRNAPSPAATASLAIGSCIADELLGQD